ncbi:hypothetical protein [Luteimonas abyssi]|uniref:hypothetical protein n=1 Tax=Luteimonas abyssi TaxID=1247514 RepID=UPI0012FB507C|nr:hypothetical protein [Luteimonas abyssi]
MSTGIAGLRMPRKSTHRATVRAAQNSAIVSGNAWPSDVVANASVQNRASAPTVRKT